MNLINSMSPLQVLLTVVTAEKQRMLIAIICAVFCALLELSLWMFLFYFLQSLSSEAHQPIYIAAMIAAIVLRYGFYTASVWQSHLAAYHIIQKVRQHIVRALATMQNEELKQFHRGDLEKRVNDDCQSLEPLIAHHATNIVIGLMQPLLLGSFLGWINGSLALIALSPLPLALFAQTVMMKGFASRQAKYNHFVASMHNAQLEFLRNIGIMKLFNVDAESYQQLSRTMLKHHKLVSTFTRQMIGSWVTFVTLAQTSLVLVVPFAIYKATSGTITLDELVLVVILCAGILKPWLDLTQIFGQVQQSLSSLNRLTPLFGQHKEHINLPLQPVEELRANSLTLQRGSRTLFHDVNFTLQPGNVVVIKGSSGSGKSSLLATLSGGLKLTNGSWTINGVSLASANDDDRSKFIANGDQSPVFFQGTLKENLTLANPDVGESKIWQLLELTGLAELVKHLPDGLNPSIGETKRSFSGGEVQRLAIVRAALANTPILLLDEATSHLDNLTEQKTLTGLQKYSPNQIQIVISHRPSAEKFASHLFELIGGDLKPRIVGEVL